MLVYKYQVKQRELKNLKLSGEVWRELALGYTRQPLVLKGATARPARERQVIGVSCEKGRFCA